MAEAIAYPHTSEMIHGDIKAANILIADDGHAMLCDFGLMRHDHVITSTALVGSGTLRWQAPELWDGAHKSFQSDVYAFGMTIAEVGGLRLLQPSLSDLHEGIDREHPISQHHE